MSSPFSRDTHIHMNTLRVPRQDWFGLSVLWYSSTTVNQPNWIPTERTATRELRGLEAMSDEEQVKELGNFSRRIKDCRCDPVDIWRVVMLREDLDLFCAVLKQNFSLENKRQCRYDLYFRYLKASHIWEIWDLFCTVPEQWFLSISLIISG